MLQGQFYIRLLLQILVGIVFVKAFMNMAKRNSKEIEPERHPILRVLGILAAVLGVLMGVAGIFIITQITFPVEMIGPYVSPNMIVRPSYQTLFWGYPTMPQSQSISLITGFFEAFALSAYCLLYKNSHSKWYTKVGKVIFCLLFLAFFVSATDFHYFDIPEWTSPFLFSIMAFLALRNDNEQTTSVTPVIIDSQDNNESAIISEDKEDHSRYMPSTVSEDNTNQDIITENVPDDPDVSSLEEEVIKPQYSDMISESGTTEKDIVITLNDSTNQAIESTTPDQTIKYCRHCGRRIDYISDKYCKYCGKPLF